MLAAMTDMPVANLVAALLSFTLGVELVHQVLIIPLFVLLKLLRRGDVALPMPMRIASGAISLFGPFYLAVALRLIR